MIPLREAEARAHVRLEESRAAYDRANHDAVKALANAAMVEIDGLQAELSRVKRDLDKANDDALWLSVERERLQLELQDAQAEVERLRGEAVARPAAQRPCDSCGQPLDNLQGQFVVQGHGRTREVCHRCLPALQADGYAVVAQAKGLILDENLG